MFVNLLLPWFLCKHFLARGSDWHACWEKETAFFDVKRSRAWVMTGRMTHTAHHRGQLLAMLRMLGPRRTVRPPIRAG